MSELFNFDSLSVVATVLIIFVCAVVSSYAKNYLRGDKKRTTFLLIIPFLALSLITTFAADNIFLVATAWLMSNLLLVILITHKTSWKQASASAEIALKNFALGALCLGIALLILQRQSESYLISEIVVSENISDSALVVSAILIVIAALTQSAIYPFHSWLISSLNSPTPASAIMHAGLVNGGGILLTRFAPLLLKLPEILNIIFVLGIISALVGTLWKLIQSNVKAMLACSTMSQMGFMIAQCAMGLFPAAIAHLFWHGMFKSYLFLSSPSSWQEKRLDLSYPPKISSLIMALGCGFVAVLIFAKINAIEIRQLQTTIVLLALTFIAASQVALTIIDKNPFRNFFLALAISSFLATLYASSVTLIEKIMPAQIFQPQPLNFLHILAIAALFLMWFGRFFVVTHNQEMPKILQRYYVKFLNASQPKSQTITSNRNQYNYQ